MYNLFAPMTVTEREEFLQQYIQTLKLRDGVPDLANRTLSLREALLCEHGKPPAPDRTFPGIDAETFHRNQVRPRPEPGLTPCMLWSLALAKINRGEKFGLDYKIAKKGFAGKSPEDPALYIELEEMYHTRTIPIVLQQLGLQAEILQPSPLTKLILRLIARTPQFMADILIMSAEVVGVATFRVLIKKGRELFADQPEQLKPMMILLDSVLSDEGDHVRFMRSRLGPLQLRLAAALVPVVARAILDDTPELWLLLGRQRLFEEIKLLTVQTVGCGC